MSWTNQRGRSRKAKVEECNNSSDINNDLDTEVTFLNNSKSNSHCLPKQ